MWDLPRLGLEPVSPSLAGRFSTTAPPGKPPGDFFWIELTGSCKKGKEIHLKFLAWVPGYVVIFLTETYWGEREGFGHFNWNSMAG